MDKKQKLKNLKDLEYNHLLNKQNIALVLVGTAFLYVLFTRDLPAEIKRSDLIFFLILLGITFLWYFSKQLNKVKDEIEKL